MTTANIETDLKPGPVSGPAPKPRSHTRASKPGTDKLGTDKDGFCFVTVLPDGTEANMDDPAVCRALGIWIEYAARGMAVPAEIVRQAHTGQRMIEREVTRG